MGEWLVGVLNCWLYATNHSISNSFWPYFKFRQISSVFPILILCSSEHCASCVLGCPKYFRRPKTTCQKLFLQSREIDANKKCLSYDYWTEEIHYLCIKFNLMIDMEDINRLKLVLVEKKKTGKWLAEKLEKDPSTVSKWCTNVSQPDLVTLSRIAELLNVDRRELINKSKWVRIVS